MKILHDFGVSALVLVLIVLTMSVGGLRLVWIGNQEFALAWVAVLSGFAMKVWDGYLVKRKDENGKPPAGPGV